jgi:hypothetical protein
MKYIITENRLGRIFKNFMDSQYDLKFIASQEFTDKFVDKNGDIFGIMLSYEFEYVDYSTEYSLNQMFGELTNELLLHYLRERFPDITIDGIE